MVKTTGHQRLEPNPVEVTAPLSHGNGSVEVGEGGGRGGEEEGEGEGGAPRLAWDSKLQYFFMVISYAVGLGNMWRFPYLTQQHGGGAFLIPYLLMLFVEGMPLLYLELAIGQKMRMGSVGVWNKVHPLMGGVGLASAVTSYCVAIYYNAIIMWCFFYLFNSFQSPLPWAHCPTELLGDGSNVTRVVPECDVAGATSYYWYRVALDTSPGIDQSDGIKWKMLLCLIFSWLVVYLCICKGIKSSGKVVYFTATFPYVVLTIFFIRGLTLRGATAGLLHMLTPKMDYLMNPQCWLDAATQIFFSFGLAFGGLIAFSSYNPRNNNVEKDAILVSLCNWFTAIYACTVIFAIMGFKATLMYEHCVQHNMEVLTEYLQVPGWNSSTLTSAVYHEVFEPNLTQFNTTGLDRQFRVCSLEEDLSKGAEGTGLAFIVFTQAIVEFGPSAPFWSIVFFLMLLSLGLGSEFGTIEGVATSLYDLDFHPWVKKKWLVSGILCGSCCMVGMLFVLGSGAYWVALFDAFAGSYPLILVALAETIGVGWVYGVDRFARDIEMMIGKKPSWYWRVAWKFIAPVLIVSLLVATLIRQFSHPIVYKAYNKAKGMMDDKPYPWYAGLLCAFLVLSSVLFMPGVAVLRRLGLLRYDRAKAAAADTHGHTMSTTRFLGGSTMSTRSDDWDSGHNSEEEKPPAPAEPEKPCALHAARLGPAGFRFRFWFWFRFRFR
ncbi:sodium- and chloride-dependent transporter XTRP3-like [Babylonia areolata]|uniref:sodium- and chloride-dependent transporter XTRP3-like n=1 Tax=Babylonia areolata TaxID=304850 RepID=UPI003FD5DE51